ncbi:OmpA family protein [Moraxella ovis]|uniref:OmpA family protein n=1 Tax=Moraxella ovis TaxID=29433 RepID=UPI000D9F66DE|nr:OmpA family protein [Moraxella ovis]SPX83111.1 flagellar motor protein MotS [Moraxella ovis]STZ06494.1 flagellar motor protein MotS [Moraxella ovis]
MSINKILNNIQTLNNDDSEWLPISDLMSGLMILFLFIAISLIMQVRQTAEKYKDTQQAIYKALMQEFEKDLKHMGADIDQKTLTFVFNSPDILFEAGRSNIKPSYAKTLNDFFPRYIKVVNQYKDYIEEIRIEGHTSSDWKIGAGSDTAYFENMRLSQERTRAVLNYVYTIPQVSQYRPWIKENLAAVGLSSAKIIKDEKGNEDKIQSKRVTFRIITNADEQIHQIAGEL